jgi:hypothetical protein
MEENSSIEKDSPMAQDMGETALRGAVGPTTQETSTREDHRAEDHLDRAALGMTTLPLPETTPTGKQPKTLSKKNQKRTTKKIISRAKTLSDSKITAKMQTTNFFVIIFLTAEQV